MAKNNNKKMVEAITSMEEDFAKWYTDIVKKAELIEYTSVKGLLKSVNGLNDIDVVFADIEKILG